MFTLVCLLIANATGSHPVNPTAATGVSTAMAQARLQGFDEFGETSRVVLFYARRAVSESGGVAVTPDHLVIGILRGAPDVVGRLLLPADSVSAITQRVQAALKPGIRPRESDEVPISPEVEQILINALGKATPAKSQAVRPEHILLALLETSHDAVANVLRTHGIIPEAVAAQLGKE